MTEAARPHRMAWLWEDRLAQGQPFDRFMSYLMNVTRTVYLGTRGIASTVHMVDLAVALADLEKYYASTGGPALEIGDEDIEERRKEAAFAQTQIDQGFPLLYALAVVGVWGGLEALVEDLAAHWMERHPGVKKSEPVAKIKIPLGEYEALDPSERGQFLVRQLQNGSGADKTGLSGFETVLSAVGLGGPIDSDVSKSLYEMHHVRNLIVHRAAIADRRFIEACPWKNLAIGDDVRVSPIEYMGYTTMVIRCVTILTKRVRAKRDHPAAWHPENDVP